MVSIYGLRLDDPVLAVFLRFLVERIVGPDEIVFTATALLHADNSIEYGTACCLTLIP